MTNIVRILLKAVAVLAITATLAARASQENLLSTKESDTARPSPSTRSSGWLTTR